ncbi:MAG: ribonuclease Z, partial [Thermoplasmata archaeon]|nr:ribonuclease Z [Thermoplasmata archaeon]
MLRLVFLGTGGSWPSEEASTSALGVRVPGRVLLFDCGEGTQRQLMMSSLSFMKISHVFITHFHGDHFLGLPGLIQSMALNGRKEELVVVGPGGMSEVLDVLLHLGYFSLSFPVRAVEMAPGDRISVGDLTVETFAIDHTAPGVGYVLSEPQRPGRFNKPLALEMGVPEGPLFSRLQRGEDVVVDGRLIRSSDVTGPPRPGRKMVYTGDTRPLSPVPSSWKDCTVLVHDATFSGEYGDRAREYGHSTTLDAARAAVECGARYLFLYHRSPRYKDPSVLEDEARRVFPRVRAP